MTVELTWEGKYDAEGRKCAPLRLTLPFQTVETVNESVQERQRGLDALFGGGQATEWRNRLIWGDKKYVLPSLLPEFAGKVNLIYIDPPFATGADFSFQVEVDGEEFTKEPSMIEQKAYRDTWGRGLESYLQWFYETALTLRDLLHDKGSLYVHLNSDVGYHAKIVLDEAFNGGFRSDVIWKRTSSHSGTIGYAQIHEIILYYTKSASYTWNRQHQSYEQDYIDSRFTGVDDDGRQWKDSDLTGSGTRRGETGQVWRGFDVTAKGRHWMYPPSVLEELDRKGKLYWSLRGGMPRLKQYLEEMSGSAITSMWTDIPPVNSQAKERIGYPTQKPEALLERIIKASSNEGDLVLDCFCGSGTTAAVAEKHNRRWITCDLGRFAIHTTRKRLLSILSVKPFVVQNLGKYERQLWQESEFGAEASERIAAYTKFILDLYRAQPLHGFAWLHGLKAGRVVHIGAVDAPVTIADVKAILIEWRKNLGRTGAKDSGIDVLGWEFALDMNETAKQQAQEAGVDLRFVTIPREVLEEKAVKQGDIQFFELAALSVKETIKKRTLILSLDDFIAPREYVPQEIRDKITRWEAFVDYWAVDFDYKGDTFHNQWQSYRTRKDKKLDLTTRHEYDAPGIYAVQVKVIDILGNDTTRTLRVQIK